MYDLIDRPVTALDAADQRLLVAMRRWVQALSALGAWAGTRTDPFGAAMRALNEGSPDSLVIERPCHAIVGETEAVLLALWRLVRAGREAAARGAAALLIAPAHVDTLLSAMRQAVRA